MTKPHLRECGKCLHYRFTRTNYWCDAGESYVVTTVNQPPDRADKTMCEKFEEIKCPEIKPCPWCGPKAHFPARYNYIEYDAESPRCPEHKVICGQCGASRMGWDKIDAVKNWNNRKGEKQ